MCVSVAGTTGAWEDLLPGVAGMEPAREAVAILWLVVMVRRLQLM